MKKFYMNHSIVFITFISFYILQISLVSLTVSLLVIFPILFLILNYDNILTQH